MVDSPALDSRPSDRSPAHSNFVRPPGQGRRSTYPNTGLSDQEVRDPGTSTGTIHPTLPPVPQAETGTTFAGRTLPAAPRSVGAVGVATHELGDKGEHHLGRGESRNCFYRTVTTPGRRARRPGTPIIPAGMPADGGQPIERVPTWIPAGRCAVDKQVVGAPSQLNDDDQLLLMRTTMVGVDVTM